jgi:putative aldouronate transport system substrate-binding protein
MNYAATVPPAMDNNAHWKELNQRLGITLKINYSPSDQYSAKVATTVAAGDLPDLMPLNPSDVAHLDELLEAKFQDLTPWLAGDAVAKYPSLAALPTVSWMNTVFNNKIYGIPYSIPLGNPLPSARQDVLDDLKVSAAELADGDDFQKLCEEVTDESASRWAFGVISDAQSMARIMADVPNQWRVVDGKFTAQYSVDEYKDSISYAQRLWKAGVLNPDAPTISYGQKTQRSSSAARSSCECSATSRGQTSRRWVDRRIQSVTSRASCCQKSAGVDRELIRSRPARAHA